MCLEGSTSQLEVDKKEDQQRDEPNEPDTAARPFGMAGDVRAFDRLEIHQTYRNGSIKGFRRCNQPANGQTRRCGGDAIDLSLAVVHEMARAERCGFSLQNGLSCSCRRLHKPLIMQ